MIEQAKKYKIVLVAPPWQKPFLPSVQLGVIKSYVERQISEIDIDIWSAFVDPVKYLPFRFVERCTRNSHLGELIFIALLFPEKLPRVLKELRRFRKELHLAGIEDIEKDLLMPIKENTNLEIKERCDDNPIIIGFTITFAQIFSSVYYASLLHSKYPNATIVFGGNSCQGPIGKMLLREFDFIDYIIHGEGEIPFTNLIRNLLAGNLSCEIKSIYSRENLEQLDHPVKTQLNDLNQLVVPDYDEYFQRISRITQFDTFRHEIRLPVESSRGCWWDRTFGKPDAICQFCDNNSVWTGFRTKSSEVVIRDIDYLTDRHSCLKIFFTDNVTRLKGLQQLYNQIRSLSKNLHIFTEAYPHIGIEDIACMQLSGVREIQFGIEALSSEILKLMNKGTTLIQNAFVMKMCEEFDLKNYSNMILNYPQISEVMIEKSCEMVIRLCAFSPLSPTIFDVNLYSPIARWPENYGIKNMKLHRIYTSVLPRNIQEGLLIPPNDFDSEQIHSMEKFWKKLSQVIAWWKENRDLKRKSYQVQRLLFHVDGGTFLEIHDFRYEMPRLFQIRGWARDLYQFLYYPRKLNECITIFGEGNKEKIIEQLNSWNDQFLVINDGDWWIALSVHESRPVGAYLAELISRAPSRFAHIGIQPDPELLDLLRETYNEKIKK